MGAPNATDTPIHRMILTERQHAVSYTASDGRPLKPSKPYHWGTKPGHFETSIIPFPTSEAVSKVSERASEQVSVAEGASSPEKANEWAVRANERTDERVAQYLRPNSWLFCPTVLRWETAKT